jgi:hypothetical protein
MKQRKRFHKMADLYGLHPTFEFSTEEQELKSAIGVLMTIITVVIMAIYSYMELDKMISHKEKTFIVSSYDYNLTEVG